MTKTFASILETIRREAETRDYNAERDKGTTFEKLIRFTLSQGRVYGFQKVERWPDWCAAHGVRQQDIGIDLVGTLKTGGLVAIQCKFYQDDKVIAKPDIDSFLAASAAVYGNHHFDELYVVDTAQSWNQNALLTFENQEKPTKRLTIKDFEDSDIDWESWDEKSHLARHKERKSIRAHQEEAVYSVIDGFREASRGKLIMACGTGKTFTSLKIAEELCGKGKRVLFLAPSLALVNQSILEWRLESGVDLKGFAVCSDADVGKDVRGKTDEVAITKSELAYPATTDAKILTEKAKEDPETMVVIFSTYHSVGVIEDAQKLFGMPDFDLMVCDEAHRTTGASDKEKESHFKKVHGENFIGATKRLYMTATPRVYAESVKAKAEEKGKIFLASMDDEKVYGKELYRLSFSDAIDKQLLTDYKVLILSVHENAASQALFDNMQGKELNLSDQAKLIGCYKGLLLERLGGDETRVLKRGVAFWTTIKDSKRFAEVFPQLVENYNRQYKPEIQAQCACQHIDGTMRSNVRSEKLHWLEESAPSDVPVCRILSNAKCLSEGVDVPSLDTVMFLKPRKSQIDVVQAVGRVMRKLEGKRYGYIILPVAVRPDVSPEEALNDNEAYKVVWETLQALRSHDERLIHTIQSLELTGELRDERIQHHLVSVGEDTPESDLGDELGQKVAERIDQQSELSLDKDKGYSKALCVKIVERCGDRLYWKEWADSVAARAASITERISYALDSGENPHANAVFEDFLIELRDDINPFISKEEAVEMLSQHIITKPIFEALFGEYSFAGRNPVSMGLQRVSESLMGQGLESETKEFEKFYEQVRERVKNIKGDSAAREKLMTQLYENFFQKVFKNVAEKLGIVYTPIEAVDFILHSVNDLLKQEFGATLGSQGVNILDPFTGTGTFIKRLIQGEVITDDQLPHKYRKEIHANEIVLLAYYIAAINIEQAYHERLGEDYQNFEGICLTDTFQMHEGKEGVDTISALLEGNSKRRNHQKSLDIRVIIGNPPYSIGQRSQNDHNQNTSYESLNESIRQSYAKESKATLAKGLYDSYIRAIRWASDRIGEKEGVIGFITNAGFINATAMDGLRKCLAKEFSTLYIVNLRGNGRTQGETAKKEGDPFFSSSRIPATITFLVKNPQKTKHGEIYYYAVGDYWDRAKKLAFLQEQGSVVKMDEEGELASILPDSYGDWINQRLPFPEDFIPLGNKTKGATLRIFESFSLGVFTSRDAWAYNFSKAALRENMQRSIAVYHRERGRYHTHLRATNLHDKKRYPNPQDICTKDPKEINWSVNVLDNLKGDKESEFHESHLVPSLYRPFVKQWTYFDRQWNERVFQMPQLFPFKEAKNRVFSTTGIGESQSFSTLMTDILPNLHTVAGAQWFPLYLYEPAEKGKGGLFDESPLEASERGFVRRSAISAETLSRFQEATLEAVSAEDIFYYLYALLHDETYRTRYANTLKKEMPQAPIPRDRVLFAHYAAVGRALGDLHCGYESLPFYEGLEIEGDSSHPFQSVKFRSNKDKSAIFFDNGVVSVSGIPEAAHEYTVNGRSPLEWLVNRYSSKHDKDSDILNDPLAYEGADYVVQLVGRLVTLSLETQRLVRKLGGLLS